MYIAIGSSGTLGFLNISKQDEVLKHSRYICVETWNFQFSLTFCLLFLLHCFSLALLSGLFYFLNIFEVISIWLLLFIETYLIKLPAFSPFITLRLIFSHFFYLRLKNFNLLIKNSSYITINFIHSLAMLQKSMI